jgi:hypothetical protein
VVDQATKLKILTRASRRRLPRLIDYDDPQMIACAELIDSGDLDGCVTLGSDGRPQKVSGAFITASGKEFLEQFEIETVNPFVLAQRRRVVRAFGFAAIFIFLLVGFPKTNESGQTQTRTSFSLEPVNPKQPQPGIIPNLEKPAEAHTISKVRIDGLKFVHALCMRNHLLE